jgi:cold shock CspA family protein
MMTSVALPPTLIAAVQEQRAILFLGSGASRDAVHPKGAQIPVGEKLRDILCDKYFAGRLKDRHLTAVAAMAAAEVGLTQLQKYVREIFLDYGPADFHMLLPKFRWRAIATTNFDLVLERAYERSRGAVQTLVKSVKDGDLFDTRMNETTDPVGYGFVRPLDFPTDLFASRGESARHEWNQIVKGGKVSFFLAFNRRGPRAIKLTPLRN